MKFVRIATVFLSMSCACLGQSARDIARSASKSVVLLEMSDSHGQPLSLGSGFFVSSGIIATNAHVIEGAYGGTAKLVGDTHTSQILGTVAIDRHADLALLKVDSPAPPLALGPSTSPAVGDNVYVVGNPLGLEGTFSEGIISGVRHTGEDSILQMTAPISPGSSGGPVMDGSGAVIGIAVATFRDGQSLNLAVPVADLSKLLATVSASTPVTSLGKQEARSVNQKSIVDGVAARTETGVVASNFALNRTGYSFSLTNKLPLGIFNIHVRVIYYDASKSVMDFEDFVAFPAYFAGDQHESLPPGLTKPVEEGYSTAAISAYRYYREHGADGAVKPYSRSRPRMEPAIELRVVGFNTDESQ